MENKAATNFHIWIWREHPISLEWELDGGAVRPGYTHKSLHSFFDPSQNAVFIADNERITVRYKINEEKYPNHGVIITGKLGENIDQPASGNKVTFLYEKSTLPENYVTQEQKYKSEFKSIQYITYNSYNGSAHRVSERRGFLVFLEDWRRVKP